MTGSRIQTQVQIPNLPPDIEKLIGEAKKVEPVGRKLVLETYARDGWASIDRSDFEVLYGEAEFRTLQVETYSSMVVSKHLVVPKSEVVVIRQRFAQYDHHFKYRFYEEKLYIYRSGEWIAVKVA